MVNGNNGKARRVAETMPVPPPLMMLHCTFFTLDMGIALLDGENYTTHNCDVYRCENGQLDITRHECRNGVRLGNFEISICRKVSSLSVA